MPLVMGNVMRANFSGVVLRGIVKVSEKNTV